MTSSSSSSNNRSISSSSSSSSYIVSSMDDLNNDNEQPGMGESPPADLSIGENLIRDAARLHLAEIYEVNLAVTYAADLSKYRNPIRNFNTLDVKPSEKKEGKEELKETAQDLNSFLKTQLSSGLHKMIPIITDYTGKDMPPMPMPLIDEVMTIFLLDKTLLNLISINRSRELEEQLKEKKPKTYNVNYLASTERNSECNFTILTGPKGSGKSAALRHLTTEITRQPHENRIAIFVSAPILEKLSAGKALTDGMVMSCSDLSSQVSIALEHAVDTTTSIVLCIDNLDELPEEKRLGFIEKIRRWTSMNGQVTQCIISFRDYDLVDETQFPADLLREAPVYYLDYIKNPDHQNMLITSLYEVSEGKAANTDLIQEVLDVFYMFGWTPSPIMLILVLAVYNDYWEFKPSRTIIMSRLIDIILESSKPDHIDIVSLRQLTRVVAFLSQSDPFVSETESKLPGYIEKMQNESRYFQDLKAKVSPDLQGESFLPTLGEITGLFVVTPSGRTVFISTILKQLLATEHLLGGANRGKFSEGQFTLHNRTAFSSGRKVPEPTDMKMAYDEVNRVLGKDFKESNNDFQWEVSADYISICKNIHTVKNLYFERHWLNDYWTNLFSFAASIMGRSWLLKTVFPEHISGIMLQSVVELNNPESTRFSPKDAKRIKAQMEKFFTNPIFPIMFMCDDYGTGTTLLNLPKLPDIMVPAIPSAVPLGAWASSDINIREQHHARAVFDREELTAGMWTSRLCRSLHGSGADAPHYRVGKYFAMHNKTNNRVPPVALIPSVTGCFVAPVRVCKWIRFRDIAYKIRLQNPTCSSPNSSVITKAKEKRTAEIIHNNEIINRLKKQSYEMLVQLESQANAPGISTEHKSTLKIEMEKLSRGTDLLEKIQPLLSQLLNEKYFDLRLKKFIKEQNILIESSQLILSRALGSSLAASTSSLSSRHTLLSHSTVGHTDTLTPPGGPVLPSSSTMTPPGGPGI